MTIDEAYVWYRGTPNALSELLEMKCEHEMIVEENAKLRELARHMGACIQHLDRTDEDGGCVRCPYQTVEHDCGFEQCMAELGIEVD